MELRRLGGLAAENVGGAWHVGAAPASLVSSHNEERPIRALREVAADPIAALRAATAAWTSDRTRATAFAELAVTGRRARAAFRHAALRAGDLGGTEGASVLAYAELVDGYLGAGPSDRRIHAAALARHKQIVLPDGVDAPWLAVAGEVDAPHRPVNVGVTAHAQHDLVVPMRSFNVAPIAARYAVVGDLYDNAEGVVLLLHGLGSRLEETEHVAEALAAMGYAVVSVDLPSQGYSDRVLPASFADPTIGTYYTPSWQSDAGYQYLALNEAFIEGFVEELGIRHRLVALGGGSLGGTLALRLAMTHRLGPMVRYVAWSPGSVWGTQQTNYVNWAAIEASLGTRLFAKELLADDHEPRHADSRRDYISWIFDSGPPFIKKQPSLWFKGISRQEERTQAARLDRRELYGFEHRIACLALAYEQTIYSICEVVKGEVVPRYARIVNPTLVIAGSRDDDALDIHREVEKLAERMRRHGRRGRVVLLDACHSIHDERPGALAAEIDSFLRDPAMGVLR
jgi:alpha-beta hydrolase superfamily lysophospholipase